jgi:D-aspartate ligase
LSLPPAIIVGGAGGNALSVARSLGRHGVEVLLLTSEWSPDRFSRYARRVGERSGASDQESWARFLLGDESEPWRGAVLLACSDAGIEILIEHRAELAAKFVLDISDPGAQRILLDKLSTYRAARDAGVPTPLFWSADSVAQVEAQQGDYVYPLLVKPLYSHRFQAVFAGAKYVRVNDFAELLAAYRRVREHDLDVVLLEEIPGADDRLCSYYTYLDEDGTALCDFTKRIVRRFPAGEGIGCYHVTDWIPEARDLGLRLLRHVGLQGVGNIEFKRDERDGRLKVIECNARFTAANGLLVASGCDLGLFVYERLIGGRPAPPAGRVYRQGLHFWRPGKDLRSFLAARGRGETTSAAYLASLAHRQVLPFFSWSDPLPSLVGSLWFAGHASKVVARRVGARGGSASGAAG